jgi:hypothetical protein
MKSRGLIRERKNLFTNMGIKIPQKSRIGATKTKFWPSQEMNLRRMPFTKPITITFIRYIVKVYFPNRDRNFESTREGNLTRACKAGIEKNPITSWPKANFGFMSKTKKEHKNNKKKKQLYLSIISI